VARDDNLAPHKVRAVPLQNRVTPFGELVAVSARGTMLGNRGILHDDHRRIVRMWCGRRWICCVLEWKGIRRTIMKPHSYTELFFLDEATAFAAGHRPCFECRRPAALAYQAAWARAFGRVASADEMDEVLDTDRRDRRAKKTYRAAARGLPVGTFVADARGAWLLCGERRLRWTAARYAEGDALPEGDVDVLTPRATVEVLRAGYVPGVHSSAARACLVGAPR
jgi:hypothetical protein